MVGGVGAGDHGCDLVLLPEMSLTGYRPSAAVALDHPSVNELVAATSGGPALCFGLVETNHTGGRPFITQVIAEHGQIVAVHRKSHLGPGLGRPLVDSIVGSRHKNMKELRPGSSGRSEVRILFAFDPKSRAILLLAGDKQGAWAKWYRKTIPVADDRYDEHLEHLEQLKKGGQ